MQRGPHDEEAAIGRLQDRHHPGHVGKACEPPEPRQSAPQGDKGLRAREKGAVPIADMKARKAPLAVEPGTQIPTEGGEVDEGDRLRTALRALVGNLPPA